MSTPPSDASSLQRPPEPREYSYEDFHALRASVAGGNWPSTRSRPPGWSNMNFDPGQLLIRSPHLALAEGMVLRGYQFQAAGGRSDLESGGEGDGESDGHIVAMPASAPYPEPQPGLTRFQPPSPSDALASVMMAIKGDGSPHAFVAASLLSRVLTHGPGYRRPRAGWGGRWVLFEGHVGRHPAQIFWKSSRWFWRAPAPTHWAPQVRMLPGGPIVTFHTLSTLGGNTINRHTHTFGPRGMMFETQNTLLAIGDSAMHDGADPHVHVMPDHEQKP